MELVDGRTLDKASTQLALNEKLQLLKDASEALHAAHEQGIIHRDIKPSNIMVERSADGSLRPVIMDFGLARESGDSHGLTESGAVMGTPAYMSPEQARGEARRLDRRSDVYSLGATLYDILSGKPPFEDQTVLNILLKVMSEPPTPLRSLIPELPEAIELVVSKCLNKEPQQRYQTAQALADDLGRYLTEQRVEAKRLSYSYQLRYWARHNKMLAALGTLLFFTVLAATGVGIRARLAAIQKERLAKEQAELARWLGQSVKDLEWVARTMYLLPLHDTRYEQQLVRDRMAELEAALAKHPEVGARLIAYARGRSLLALHQWQLADEELQKAERLGHVDLELDYARGRALGALYSQALDDARKSGDKSFFEKRKAELDQELLRPALSYLEKSQGLRSVSATYVEGLVAYYQEQYDRALQHAERAYQQAPWLYEAVLLSGDVFLARARSQRDRGEHDQAEQSFRESVSRYQRAAEIGRSDHHAHEALAEANIRWEELEFYRGRSPEPKLTEALAAADRALLAAPQESHGHTKKAFAYDFQAQHALRTGKRHDAIRYRKAQLQEGQAAIAQHPDDAYAHETTGIASFRLAEILLSTGQEWITLLQSAFTNFDEAIMINRNFPWAYNDYALTLIAESKIKFQTNSDPTPLLQKAIQFAELAIRIDPGYLYAINTITLASLRASSWQTEHGKNPEPWTETGLRAARDALNINKNYSYAHGNIGAIYTRKAIFEWISNTANPSTIHEAIRAYQEMAKITGQSSEIHSYIGAIHHVKSLQLIEENSNPNHAISDGLEAISHCSAPPESDPYCIDVQARLLSTKAIWKKKQGQPFLHELELAYRLSKQAVSQLPADEVDSFLQAADAALQFATSTSQNSAVQRATIQYGLQSVERALQSANGLPRALVLRGALLLLQARAEANPQRRRSGLLAAQSALQEGLKGNPLLKRWYEGFLTEATRRLAPR